MRDTDISYNLPNEKIAAPSEGYVMISVPFVGIYKSILSSEIEIVIEGELEWEIEENGTPFSKAEVNLKNIYRDIAEYSAKKLGFETAVYAGADLPKQCNYNDDLIYVWVKESELRALERKYGLEEDCSPKNLFVALANDSKDLAVEAGEDIYYSIAMALFQMWHNSHDHSGYEVIMENIEFI